MAEVVTYSIFSSAWFWLLLVAILFLIVGVILLALVGTAWGVGLILLGVLFLIAAGLVGFFTSTRNTAVALLNTEGGAQIGQAVTRQFTEMVPVNQQITRNVPVTEQVVQNVTRNVPVTENIVRQVPVTRTVTETVRRGPPVVQMVPARQEVYVQPVPVRQGYPIQPTQVGQFTQVVPGNQAGDQGLNNLIRAASAPAPSGRGVINGFPVRD